MSTHPQEWLPDPARRHELRWWDGDRWTEHVSDGGEQGTDPPGESELPPPPPHAAGSGTPTRRSGRATASFVLGIVGVLVFPVVCSTLAIIFGALALRDIGTNPDIQGRRMAWWGLGLGITGLVLGIAIIGYRFV
ncbi:MAG: DUF4190 domain-containing protein [Thermoleophilia bacterium]|nr:DUF4190 domain-containing protein [Thermoleophilia bacterium]